MARALTWTAGLVAGLSLFVMMRGRYQRRALQRDWRVQGRQEHRERSLHDAILGTSRHSIAAVFGPPRTWLTARPGPAQPAAANYWNATTWYYALDATTRSAMAIRFDDDRAAEVDFIHAPTEARGVLRHP